MKKIVLFSTLLASVFLLSACQNSFLKESGVQDTNDEEVSAQTAEEEIVGLEEEEIDTTNMSDKELLKELESMDEVFVDDVSEIDSEL